MQGCFQQRKPSGSNTKPLQFSSVINASIPLKKFITNINTWATANEISSEKIFPCQSGLFHFTEVIFVQIFRQLIGKLRFNQHNLQRFADTLVNNLKTCNLTEKLPDVSQITKKKHSTTLTHFPGFFFRDQCASNIPLPGDWNCILLQNL